MNIKTTMDTNVDDEWLQYLSSISDPQPKKTSSDPVPKNITTTDIPKCGELYISTKTKVLYLNQEIDIHRIFWEIPILEYWRPVDGVVKKQIKIVSKSQEEYDEYRAKLENIPLYNEHVIKQINNPAARRIKFKDERKITVGVSKKDIMSCRGKVKNAFYNCFAIIFRFKFENVFREIHVKVFNTGKLEVPGVANPEVLEKVQVMILELLKQHVSDHIEFKEINTEENVLINSNFNCGFYINRERLHSILHGKYGIETAYDPCSYPGVKCKFYFNNEVGFAATTQSGKIDAEDLAMKMNELILSKKYTEISLMIFRTGSCLIVGNCTEPVLRFVFEFICRILQDEFSAIQVENTEGPEKIKKTKLRKKTITVGGVDNE